MKHLYATWDLRKRASLLYPYDVCADLAMLSISRFGGKPDASRAERRRSRLHYRHAHGGIGAGALDFHHSMNYRSVVALGKATLIDDPAEKLQALRPSRKS